MNKEFMKKYNNGEKFDVVLMNPPYDGNLHLKFIDKCIDCLTTKGSMVVIHPARWFEDPLAEYKKNSDKNKFKRIVDRLDDVEIINTKDVTKYCTFSFNLCSFITRGAG